MVTKSQAGGGVAAAVAVGAGTGVGVTLKNKWDESQFPSMPLFTVLSQETNFDNEYSKSTTEKITGWVFGGYLVGTYGVGDSSKNDFNDNKAWWEWSYNRWKVDVDSKASLSSDFGSDKIEKPFSTKESSSEENSNKALNKVCETVYKKKSTVVGFTSTSGESSKQLIKDLLKYCSPLQQIPRTIVENEETSSVGDGLSSKVNFLISVKDRFNNMFWRLRNDDFFRTNGNIWSGSGLDSSKHPLFHELYSKGKDNITKTVKEICRKAYSQTQYSEGTDDDDDVVKFCSWSYGIYVLNNGN